MVRSTRAPGSRERIVNIGREGLLLHKHVNIISVSLLFFPPFNTMMNRLILRVMAPRPTEPITMTPTGQSKITIAFLDDDFKVGWIKIES